MPSLQVISSITLNVQRPNSNIVVYAKQYDIASRIIDINLTNGTSTWDPPAECEIVAMFDKPDGTKCIYDTVENYPQYSSDSTYSAGDRVRRLGNIYQCNTDIETPEAWNASHWSLIGPVTPAVTKTGTGQIRLTLAEQALTAAGNVLAEISFYTDSLRTTTLSFVISVEKGVPDDETFRSNDYFNVLSETIQGLLGVSTHPPVINPNNYLWQYWNEAQAGYVDNEDGLSAQGVQGERGYTGYNVGSVARTSGTGAKGTTDTYTMYLNDDVSNPTPVGTFEVYQGQDGTGAPGNTDPLPDDDTASIGSSSAFAHEDHVHPLNKQALVDLIYPIGSIYMSKSSTDPSILFGGTWEAIQNSFLIGAGDLYTVGVGGGATAVTLTLAQMPRHRHQIAYYANGQTLSGMIPGKVLQRYGSATVDYDRYANGDFCGYAGGSSGNFHTTGPNDPISIMPPYVPVYMWERVADPEPEL